MGKKSLPFVLFYPHIDHAGFLRPDGTPSGTLFSHFDYVIDGGDFESEKYTG